MVLHGYTVVAQNVDLLGNLLTALHAGLQSKHLGNPLLVDMALDVLGKLGIFQILGVRIDGVYGRVALLVGTVLLQSIEATCHLLGVLRYWFLQVTAGRRYGTEEGNAAHLAIVQVHITGTAVEVGHQCAQVHGESVGTRQLLHTVTHLAQSLCPTRGRVRHQQHAQAH